MSACGLVHTLLLAALFEETLPEVQRSKTAPRFQSPMGMMEVNNSRLACNGVSVMLCCCTY